MAALATIADVVVLHGENRILTAAGLRLLRSSRNPGLRALVEASGVLKDRETPKASDVAFRLAPMLNAAGRLASADSAIHLMTRADDDEAVQIVTELGRLNRQRQKLCREITEQASAMVVQQGFDTTIVVRTFWRMNPNPELGDLLFETGRAIRASCC